MTKQNGDQKLTTSDWQADLEAERLRIATKVLPIVIGVSTGFVLLYTVSYFMFGRPWQWAWAMSSTYVTLLLAVLAYVLARQGRSSAAVYAVALAFGVQAVVQPALIEGMVIVGLTTGFLAIIFARLLAGRAENRVVVLISGVAIMLGFLLSGFQSFDPLSQPMWLQLVIGIMSLIPTIIITALILGSRDQRYEASLAQAEAYATELGAQRAILEKSAEDLARRARHLEATATVARDAVSVLDLTQLLSRVVTLVSEQFGFYYAGLFLLDPSGEWAELRAASSDGGQRMLARGHRLRVGEEGIVGYVISRGEPRIALDVGADAVHFDTPELPDTRSEMALPLWARGEIIGALDVQSREPEAFSEEDVAMLQTLADQVAAAIDNARLFQQAQESLEAERRAYGELSRQAWEELLRAQTHLGFLSDRQGTFSTDDLWGPQMERVLRTGEITSGDGDGTSLAIPIRVRGHVIGVIDAHKSQGANEWTPEEIALMETLTEQLSAALESARLYQDTQRRAAHEQLIGQVTARMRESLDMDIILQTTVREMREALGIGRVEVRLDTGQMSERE